MTNREIEYKNITRNSVSVVVDGEVFNFTRDAINEYLVNNWVSNEKVILESNGVIVRLDIDDFVDLLHRMNKD